MKKLSDNPREECKLRRKLRDYMHRCKLAAECRVAFTELNPERDLGVGDRSDYIASVSPSYYKLVNTDYLGFYWRVDRYHFR